MALNFADRLVSNNPSAYGIVRAIEVSGHKTVSSLSALYKIPDCILSDTGDNSGNDSLGQLWYVIDAKEVYQLVNWEKRNEAGGWKPYLSGVITDEALEEILKTKQDKLIAGEGISISEDNVISCTIDTSLFRMVDELPSLDEAETNKIYLLKKENNVGELQSYTEYIVSVTVDEEGIEHREWEKIGEYDMSIELAPYLKIEDAEKTYVKKENIVDSFEGGDPKEQVLSAEKGKELKGLIDSLEERKVDSVTATPGKGIIVEGTENDPTIGILLSPENESKFLTIEEETGLELHGVQDAIDEAVKDLSDNVELKSDVVYNVNDIFPGEGDGEDKNTWTIQWAIAKLDALIPAEEKVAGIKCKFQSIQGKWRTFTYYGGYFLDRNNWSYDLTSKDFVELATVNLPTATPDANGVMSKEDKAKLDGISGSINQDVDDKIAAVKEIIDNYKVNGYKISENPSLDRNDIGLGNVTNDAQVKRSEMGVPEGVATLGKDGKVPESQLPDSVLGNVKYQGVWDAVNNIPELVLNDFESIGHYYIAINKGSQFGYDFDPGDWVINSNGRWVKVDNVDSVKSVNGKIGIVELGIEDIPGLEDALDSKTTDEDFNRHISDYNNPHKVTKDQVGLGNVDNTADKDKPVSDATQSLIDSTKTELQTNIDNLATKTENDLEAAKLDFNNKLTSLETKHDTELKETKTELQTNIDNLASKTENDLTVATKELNNKISELSTKTEADLSTLRSDLESSISVTKTDLESKINDLSTKTDAKFQATDSKIEATKTELQTNIDNLSHRHDDDMKDIRQEIEDAISGSDEALNEHIADKNNPHQVTKEQVGLSEVTNDAQVKRSEMAQPGGVATLDESGKVPSSQLPSFVDDVIEVDSFDLLPEIGESGKIYVTKDTNLTYRWSGSQYIEISESLALGETSSTAYPGDKGKATTDKVNAHTTDFNNPHQVNKEQVGLGNVDNTSDKDKPVSDATQELVDNTKKELEELINNSGNNLQENIDKLDERVTKVEDSIGAPEGIATLDKDGQLVTSQIPEEALNVVDGKYLSETQFTDSEGVEFVPRHNTIYIDVIGGSNKLYRWDGFKYVEISDSDNATELINNHIKDFNNPHKVTKAQVGLGNVDNTADIDKPISTAVQEALDSVNTKVTEHIENKENPHSVTAEQIGLGNVDNTADYDKPVSKATQDELDKLDNRITTIDNSIGVPSGLATLDGEGKLTDSQIPDKTINVLVGKYVSETEFKDEEGSTYEPRIGVIYIDTISGTEKIYRWNKFEYVEISNTTELEGIVNSHISNTENPHKVTKEQVGLGNVTNDAQVKRTEMGAPEGVATLNENGKIPIEQLPGQVDEVFGIDHFVSTKTDIPSSRLVVGTSYYVEDEKKIYTAISETELNEGVTPDKGVIYSNRETNIIYRWDGAELVEIGNPIHLGEVAGTAYPGDKGKATTDKVNAHVSNFENPHKVTAEQVGLGNVDNTSDADKPISTATQEALDNLGKEISDHKADKNNPHEVTKEQIGLGNVENTADIDKPVSTATQKLVDDTKKELDTKIDNHTSDFNNPHQVTKEQVGLSNVDNTADINKPVSVAQQALVDSTKAELKQNISDIEKDVTNHVADKNNPHEVNKLQVGLGNVDNTSDINKPVSTAQQAALDKLKSDLESIIGSTGTDLSAHIKDFDNPHKVTKDQVGLGKVDNTTDLEKPVSVAQQEAINTVQSNLDKTNTTLGNHIADKKNPHDVTKDQVGLGNVDNTADIDKPVSHYQQDALDELERRLQGSIDGSGSDLSAHLKDYNNPHKVTKEQVGLGNVDNTSDKDKPISDATQKALDTIKTETNTLIESHIADKNNPHQVTKEQVGLSKVTNDAQVKRSEMGVAGGVATLDQDGKVPSSQLPSFVDDVIEVDSYDNLPTTGEAGKIYVTKDTNLTYRWSGTKYTEISASLALGETSSTAYPGDKGKETTDKVNVHVADFNNPHQVNKEQVGLGNVDNTSDLDKPVSNATQELVDKTKEELTDLITSNEGGLSAHIKDYTNPHRVTKDQVGLGNVDNTSDIDKPISNATQEALDNITNNITSIEDKLGQPNGIATLDPEGKVPSSQLPSFVDDVIEVDSFDLLPETGETGKIYVTKDTNLTYRWSGSRYIEISASLALGETSSTAYPGDKGKATTDKVNAHTADYNNPHKVDKAQVGLGNVDNTSDADKPVSDATQKLVDDTKKELEELITSNEGGLSDHIKDFNNPHKVTAEQLGLGNVDNTSDIDKPISNATQEALDNITNNITNIEEKIGKPNGIASLDSEGKVPASQLPSYVDDVIEVDSYDNLPVEGEAGKIYVTKDTNLTYRWSGTKYTEISASLALGETSSTAYPGDKGKATTDKVDSHVIDYNNPHKVDKAQVGLSNVDNTSDKDKPVSDATLIIINEVKESISSGNTTITDNLNKHISDYNNPHKVTKDQVGLGNVDNTSDKDKPLSDAVKEAIKEVKDSIISSGTDLSAHIKDYTNPHRVTKDQVGLGNVDNTADIDKPVSTATQKELDKLDAKIDKINTDQGTDLSDHLKDYNNPHKVTKDQVGLGNVDNTSDKEKPISDATQKAIDDAIASGNTALDNHANRTDNPHKVTKDQVGLGNVDNTADTVKPVSVPQQAALDALSNSLNTAINNHVSNINNPHQVTKDQVGLGKVDNTSDLEKPISVATQGAINTLETSLTSKITEVSTNLDKHVADKNNPHEVTKEQVGLGRVDNTSDKEKPISDATQAALDKKVDLTPDNKVPEDQLPVRTMHSMYYKGLWDAKLNSPVLNNGNKDEDGDYYLVTNGGERFGYVFMSSDIVFNASGSWYRLMGSNQRDEKTKFEIVSFTADRYEIERGESASITFDWEYQMTPDRQVNFQFLNEYNVPVEDRTYTVTGITQDKEFILNGFFLNETAQASLEIKFYDKFYVGTSSNATASNEDLHKMDAYFVNGKDQAPLKDFDCSGGKYIYVAIPSDSKDKYKIFSNNMLVTDTVDTTRTVTNASGGTAEYVISRFANKYNGVLSIEVKLID